MFPVGVCVLDTSCELKEASESGLRVYRVVRRGRWDRLIPVGGENSHECGHVNVPLREILHRVGSVPTCPTACPLHHLSPLSTERLPPFLTSFRTIAASTVFICVVSSSAFIHLIRFLARQGLSFTCNSTGCSCCLHVAQNFVPDC